VTLALRPKASTPLTAAAIFTDVAAACTAVNDYLSSGVRPSLLELMDGPTIKLVSAYRELGFPSDTEAVLIAQSDDECRAAADLDAFAEVCRRLGASEVVVAENPVEGRC
jgi:glycolate oxidase